MAIPLEGASLLSAHEVPENLLRDFYARVYPGRRIASFWRWWYRGSFLHDRAPLVILHQDRVIAHAGIIPFRLRLEGRTWNAAWFVDFAVLPEYQRHGLGIWLTRKWMELSELFVTFCNEKSMGVFLKYGWKQSFDTHLHYVFLRPFDHPAFARFLPGTVRGILNAPVRPALDLLYRLQSVPLEGVELREPEERDEAAFIGAAGKGQHDAIAVRDAEWFRWRVLSSPDRSLYRIMSLDGVTILFKLGDGAPPRSADVLWISDPSRRDTIRRMIATIARLARQNGCSYVQFYTSDPALSRHLSRSLFSLVRHPRFAFFSEDGALFAGLARARWDWQLIDSDFERF